MALPFLSYGRTSVIASCVAAGILLSVSGGGGGFLEASVAERSDGLVAGGLGA